jgi:hypothetical protein
MRDEIRDLLEELDNAYPNSIPIGTLKEDGFESTVLQDAMDYELVKGETIPPAVDDSKVNNKEKALRLSLKGSDLLDRIEREERETRLKVLGIFITIGVAIFIFGLTYRPVVEYYITSPPKIIPVDNTNINQEIYLSLSNSGQGDAPIIIDFKCINATISAGTVPQLNDNETRFNAIVNKGSPGSFPIFLYINTSKESFSCLYQVNKNTDNPSLSGRISNFFGEIQQMYPTYFYYKKVDSYYVLQN